MFWPNPTGNSRPRIPVLFVIALLADLRFIFRRFDGPFTPPTSRSFMPDRKTLADAFQRILKVPDRTHLDLPFRNDSALRSKYFPGAGAHIDRKKFPHIYTREFASSHPNEKLFQHATFPWIHGYDASMVQIFDVLKQNCDNPVDELPPDRQIEIEKKFTKVGAEEIAVFWTIYSAASKAYPNDVITMLADAQPPAKTPAAPPKIQPTGSPGRPGPEETAVSPDTQAAYALLGSLIFFVPSIFLAATQYWRLPNESHWIVVSIAAILGLVTLVFSIVFLRKRNS